MRLARVLQMGLTEVSCRSRQGLLKRLERMAPVARPRAASDGAAAAELAVARFFEGPVNPLTPALVRTLPGAVAPLITAAEAARGGRFDLLGYRGLRFGDPIDWHLDPVSGRRAPRVHWSRIDPLDAATVGDSKVVWELNRHQWAVGLGQAYRLTGDERFGQAFADYFAQWEDANPRGVGINWASSLEAALRLISWCWVLVLFDRGEALSPAFSRRVRAGISAHAAHVERYLSHYYSPNTHLTGEALGLFYAGTLFPAARRAERWRALATRILVEESRRQILPDGVYFEQSVCYQRYTIEIYLHFLLLAQRSGMELPPEVEARVTRMLDFLLALRHPDGSMPRIGDADGGWLLPLGRRSPDDLGDVFSTAAALFRRPEYAWAAGGLAPETIWLLGPAAAAAFAALTAAPPGGPASRLFEDGGYAVMRSGWDPRAHQLIVDVGPLGCPVSAGHGHADLLSVQAAVFGEPCLVDAGTACYTGDRAWRDFSRGTSAHSTVSVDGVGQAVPSGPFSWRERPRARLVRWLSTEGMDVADAEHDAYHRLADPVSHRRRVIFVKPAYWLVVDELRGTAEHTIELRFQFAPARELSLEPAAWVRARGSRGSALLVRAFAAVPLKVEILEGERAPLQGWVSPVYGQREPAPVLVYSAVTPLPLRIITLLLPMENPLGAPPVVSPLSADGAGPTGIVFENAWGEIRVDDDVPPREAGVETMRPRASES